MNSPLPFFNVLKTLNIFLVVHIGQEDIILVTQPPQLALQTLVLDLKLCQPVGILLGLSLQGVHLFGEYEVLVGEVLDHLLHGWQAALLLRSPLESLLETVIFLGKF